MSAKPVDAAAVAIGLQEDAHGALLHELTELLQDQTGLEQAAKQLLRRLCEDLHLAWAAIGLTGAEPSPGFYHWQAPASVRERLRGGTRTARPQRVERHEANIELRSDGMEFGRLLIKPAGDEPLSDGVCAFLELLAAVLGTAIQKDLLARSVHVQAELIRNVEPPPAEVAVVVLTGRDEVHHAIELVREGDATILPKTAGTDILKAAEAHTAPLLSPITPTELEVLRQLRTGRTNDEIARLQHRSKRTIEFHCGNIYAKLGVRSRTEAIVRAHDLGLI